MGRKDISFLEDTPDQVEMPLTVTGTCEGIATLMQKVTTLMLANDSDNTRNYGGSLSALVIGANMRDTDVLQNYFQQSAVSVYQLLQEEDNLNLHDLPDSERIDDLQVESVTIDADDYASVQYRITNKAGDTEPFTLNISITETGE